MVHSQEVLACLVSIAVLERLTAFQKTQKQEDIQYITFFLKDLKMFFEKNCSNLT